MTNRRIRKKWAKRLMRAATYKIVDATRWLAIRDRCAANNFVRIISNDKALRLKTEALQDVTRALALRTR